MQTVNNSFTSNSRLVLPKGRTTWYNIGRIMAFILLAALFILFLECLFQNGGSVTDRKRAIELQPANSIDVMFIGNSHSYCTFNPAVIEPVVNKRVFNAGLPDQKIDMAYYTLQEFLKRQKPEIVVLEAFAFGRSDSEYQGYTANIDAMKPSVTKFKECFGIFQDKWDAFRMSIGLFRSHNNWKNPPILLDNLKYMLGIPSDDRKDFNGFYVLDSRMTAATIRKYKDAGTIKFAPVVDEYTSGYFKRIVKLCRDRNIRLIVTMAPFNDIYIQKVAYKDFNEKMNHLCKDENIEFIDFNMLYEQIGLTYDDFEDAFHHAQHINKWGAEKVSRYLAEYLKKTQQTE